MMNNFLNKALIGVLSAGLLLGTSVPVHARMRRVSCEQRIRNAELRLQKAIRKHGTGSRQAETRRRELQQVRARCHR